MTLKNDVARGLIALGNWLILTKENLSHGEYLDWLKYEVKIHRTTAWRYTQIAKNIDQPTLDRVGSTKIYEILESPLPQEQKEGLMARADKMTEEEIQKIVDTPKKVSQDDYPQVDKIVDDVLNEGLDFIEKLKEINWTKIPENWKDFGRSQLAMFRRVLEEEIKRI